MRNALILVRRHGEPENSRELFSDPSALITDTLAQYKREFCMSGTHSDYEIAELWESSTGIVKTRRLQPAPAPIHEPKKGKK